MKNFKELSIEELELVFENNSKLQENVFDDMFDNANFWCSEYLNCWKNGSIDYCIGWDRGTYFSVKDCGMFLEGLEKAQKLYGFLSDDYNHMIEKAWELYDKYTYHAYDFSDLNYERIENRLTDIIETLESACYKRFMNEYEYCFDSKNQLDYFLDFYSDARMNDDFYVDENYVLFEHVDYVKSYN